MRRPRLTFVPELIRVLAVAWILVVAAPASAAATPLLGLTSQSCFAGAALDGCRPLAGELNGAQTLAISPDGGSVYVASFEGGQIAAFRRVAATGALERQACFSDAALADCTVLAGRLAGANAVTVSPDGTTVYATSLLAGTLTSFSRDPRTGALAPQQCFSNAALADCTVLSGQLEGALSVAVSADGLNVYLTATVADKVITFSRDPASGALERKGCLANGSSAGCTVVPGLLDAPAGMATSTDGATVYVASFESSAIVAFARDAGDGALRRLSCTSNATLGSCTVVAGQLSRPRAVVVSPGGDNVYATGSLSDTLVTFSRAEDGTLTPQECLSNAALMGCTAQPGVLDTPFGLAVSPDGASVYLASSDSSTLLALGRQAADGRLTSRQCFANAVLGACTVLPGRLQGAVSVAVSPDAAGVYAVAARADTLLGLARELPPTCRATASSGSFGAEQRLRLDCSDPNADPLEIAITRGPRGGNVGVVDQVARTVAYTPAAGFSGADDVTVVATSDGKTSAPATIAITVGPRASAEAAPPGDATASPVSPAPPTTTAPGRTGPPPPVALRVRFLAPRRSARRGRAIRLPFTSTRVGTARLTVRRGRRTVARRTVKLTRAGTGAVSLTATTMRRLRPGTYTLRLSFTATGSRAAVATGTLTVRGASV